MSKAFTKEDEGAGFEVPEPSARLSAGARLTAYGARLLREKIEAHENDPSSAESFAIDRLRGLLASAEVVLPAGGEHAALGALVRVREDDGDERSIALVTPDEVGLVPSGVSVASPLAVAVLGAREGDIVEIERPRGATELTVLAITWPT